MRNPTPAEQRRGDHLQATLLCKLYPLDNLSVMHFGARWTKPTENKDRATSEQGATNIVKASHSCTPVYAPWMLGWVIREPKRGKGGKTCYLIVSFRNTHVSDVWGFSSLTNERRIIDPPPSTTSSVNGISTQNWSTDDCEKGETIGDDDADMAVLVR